MPKYAIISELHANWAAFFEVYKSIKQNKEIRDIVCLGDIVGYGPEPNEVIHSLRQMEQRGYRVQYNLGSHDAAALGMFVFISLRDEADIKRVKNESGLENEEEIIQAYHDLDTRRYIPVRPEAKAAMDWTLKTLTNESRNFMRTRMVLRIMLKEGVVCVHASIRDPIFEYVRDARCAQRCFESEEMENQKVCFVGHTHFPVIWRVPREARMSYAGNVVLVSEPECIFDTHHRLETDTYRYIVNVGAVGQPRDGDARACYVIYDSDADTVTYVRLDYEVTKTQQKILRAGLPAQLAERLSAE
ncbi:MAG TPA: metallophosphoesterase family protein [Planctomycetota bacterium]|nr:metallophosphoesterase family protein [Planctomycetota bacterium]